MLDKTLRLSATCFFSSLNMPTDFLQYPSMVLRRTVHAGKCLQ